MLSREMKEKLEHLRRCKKCKAIGRSIIYWKKKRCMLCGKLTRKFKVTANSDAVAVEKVKNGGGDKKIVQMITNRTADFDCPGEISAVIEGPVVTEYEFTPDRYTRVNKLKSLSEDLALSLAVETVSIRRIPGRPCIGISIPNATRQEVTFENCTKNIIEHADDMQIPLNFGILADGSPYVEDLARYPHLLIGGATGTGKSVLLNQLLTNLLLVRSPAQLRLMLIDPKTVELFPYKNIPHLMRQPISQVWDAIAALEDVIKVMKSRTETLHDYKVNSIVDLNKQFKDKAAQFTKDGKHEWAKMEMEKCWPYILVVIDEMANIILEEKKDFIARMAAISQMARAAGISVIAATQRPSVDVLPGKIKVNFLARGAFRMPSPQDSKTVLNFKGAETLLGKGDMFVLSPDKTGLQRIHVAHCTKEHRDPIIARITTVGYNNAGLLKDTEDRKLRIA